MHLPGIDKNNARMIMRKVKNLLELTKMSENELGELIQSKINGKKVVFFNISFTYGFSYTLSYCYTDKNNEKH